MKVETVISKYGPPRNRRLFWLGIIWLAAVAALTWILPSHLPRPVDLGAAPTVARTGFRAPSFSLATLDGKKVTLDGLRGRPVLINFWATWCPPCQAELPALQAASTRYAGDGLLVVGVDMAESQDTVAAFAQQLGLHFPLALDRDGKVTGQYGVRGLPTSIFVDRQGVVRSTYTGALTDALLQARLADILKKNSFK